MTFKNLFSRSLNANPERLHFAAHSHHLWPDASFDGQTQAWIDAAGSTVLFAAGTPNPSRLRPPVPTTNSRIPYVESARPLGA